MKNETQKHSQRIEILFEDEYICVINKPTGILSVPSQSKDKSALTVLEEIMRRNGTYSAKHRPFAVHRLDRDTSGIMMFALSEIAQKKIMDSWHKMVSERLYRAVAENPKNPKKLLPLSGLIDDDLAFNARNIGFVPKKDEGKKEQAKSQSKLFPHAPISPQFLGEKPTPSSNFLWTQAKRTRFVLTSLQKVIRWQAIKISGQRPTILDASVSMPVRWNSHIPLPGKKCVLKSQSQKNGSFMSKKAILMHQAQKGREGSENQAMPLKNKNPSH